MQAELKQQGGEVFALSVEPLERLKAGRSNHPNLPCRLVLADVSLLKQLHLEHDTGDEILSAPANILIDSKGIVRWTHYAGLVTDRPAPETVLEQVKKLRAGTQ